MLSNILTGGQEKFDATLDHLRSELATIRTAQATPLLIENLKVLAYGQEMLLKELAAISAPEANLLVVSPWDQSVLSEIEKALRVSAFHFNPVVDGNQIKVPLPLLSLEQREELVRLTRHKCEKAKVAMRSIRHEKIKSAEEMQDEGKISEDELITFKKQLQERVDRTNDAIEEMCSVKEKELRLSY